MHQKVQQKFWKLYIEMNENLIGFFSKKTEIFTFLRSLFCQIHTVPVTIQSNYLLFEM